MVVLMDILRKKNFYGKHKTKILSVGSLFFFGMLVILAYIVMEPATIEVKHETLLTDKVSVGNLSIKVQGHGKLIPKSVRWVSAETIGKVEDILVKPGSLVKKGDLLLRLSNPDLTRETAVQEWDVEALKAEHEAKLVNLETNVLIQRAAVLKADYEYVSSSNEMKAHDLLLKSSKGTISNIEFERIKLKTEQLKGIRDIEVEKLNKFIFDNKSTQTAMAMRFLQATKLFEFKQSQIRSLNVVAYSDGVVQEIVPQVGQTVLAGMALLKIVDPKDVIAEIEVPEVQASLILLEQSVNLNLRTSNVEGKVSRIDPAVINGTVKVDVQFDSRQVAGVRPDLSVEGEIVIDSLENVMFIRRPSFSQENNVSKLYVLDDAKGIANQISVQFGRSSVDKIQIVSGLKVGQTVILNDPTPWLNYQQIKVK